jgi:hypothetical protein
VLQTGRERRAPVNAALRRRGGSGTACPESRRATAAHRRQEVSRSTSTRDPCVPFLCSPSCVSFPRVPSRLCFVGLCWQLRLSTHAHPCHTTATRRRTQRNRRVRTSLLPVPLACSPLRALSPRARVGPTVSLLCCAVLCFRSALALLAPRRQARSAERTHGRGHTTHRQQTEAPVPLPLSLSLGHVALPRGPRCAAWLQP